MLDAPGGGKYMEDGRDGETLPIYWAVGANVKDDGSGFVVEYRIVKETILDPADRTQIGFDVMMNSSDSANPTVRTGKWGWHYHSNGAVFEPYNNEPADRLNCWMMAGSAGLEPVPELMIFHCGIV